jgi:molybdenum cofactor cytidylyltransferase
MKNIKVACLLLCAGKSTRMGRNKMLVDWNGSSLLQHTLAEISQAQFDEVIAVTGHDDEQITKLLHECRVVMNPKFNEGMHSSIRAGLSSLELKDGFFAVCLGDQPLISTSEYNQLISQVDAKHQLIYPSFNGERGNPVLINLALKNEILSHPDDDKGCSYLFKRYPQSCLEVKMSTDSCLIDVDTPEALEKLQKRLV